MKTDFFHEETANRLVERLDWVDFPIRRIVETGAAAGGGAVALHRRFDQALILALDTDPTTLARLEPQARQRVMAGCADPQRLPCPDAAVDLVFANLLLPALPDPVPVLREVRRVLAHPGLFLFSSLGPDSFRELRAAWRRVDDHEHVARFLDMHDLGDLLIQTGFADPVLERETLTVTYTDTARMIDDLRATPGPPPPPGRRPGLTGRGTWNRFLSACDARRDADGRFAITLELIFGQAWCPGTANRPGDTPGEIEIPLGHVRRGPR